MKQLISSILDFIPKFLSVALVSSSLLLIAGEVRLMALKKASQGSSKISGFTQKMTKTKGF